MSSLLSLTLKDALATLWAPISIFIGAWMAFYFNNRRVQEERNDKEVTEGNLALSVLAEFYSQQLQYQKNYVDAHRGAPDAWFKMMSGPPLSCVEVNLNRNELGFLLQSNGPVWQQVVLEERRFHFLAALIDERNVLIAKAWAKLEEAGIKHGSSVKLSELEGILGPVLYQQLKQMGNAIVDHVTQNVTSCMGAINALRAELIRIYPKRNFVSIVDAPTAATNISDLSNATNTKPTKRMTFKQRQGPIGKYLPHEKDGS